jgi:hypothetical protein
MRRRFVSLALLLSFAVSGCFLFREDFPNDSCNSNVDCFRAQGEVCDLELKKCVIPSDAAPVPDAPPLPDADLTPDATPPIDAPTIDASTVDAGPPDA